jgi:nitrile hydratase accessory protein
LSLCTPEPELDDPSALPHLPRPEEAVFAEPWQSTAFALAVRLAAQGHFTWKEWAATLAQELKADAARGAADDGSRYYNCWLTALERLVAQKQLCDPAALQAQKAAWVQAYLRTPHGQPVELESVDGIHTAGSHGGF